MENVYKFVGHTIPAIDELSESMAYKLMAQLNEGLKPDPKIIKMLFNELWHFETYRTGKYKLQGYIFDFAPFLKSYIVHNKYYGWLEVKGFNKTFIRELAVTPSHILKIIEL